MYNFDAKQTSEQIVQWVKDYFSVLPKETKAIIGISGGKDSTVTSTLCVKALGKERVIGILMPQGEQSDIDVSYAVCDFLGIEHIEVNVGTAVGALYHSLSASSERLSTLSDVTVFNTPARIRMATLYAIAGTINGRVVNTCNASETYVGWETKYGDAAGDFSLLSDLTVTEVKLIGEYLGVPKKFTDKTPIDGLCGKTDEEGLGFSYATLDKYIREGNCDDENALTRIEQLHKLSEHKRVSMPTFKRK